MKQLYQILSQTLDAAFNCERTGNIEWFGNHTLRLKVLVDKYMPSGSGFDAGTALDFEKQTPGQLRFSTSFHHMNDAGMYTAWTYHEIVITPNLAHGFDIRVSGRNRSDIKDYLADVFHHALSQEISKTESVNV